MAILLPALQVAKEIASSAVCLGNHKSLVTGWIMYADDNDGVLMCNGACYDQAGDDSPWVHRPKDIAGNNLSYNPAPETIRNEDRYRGIQQGTMWQYVKDVDVYHCPGDNRKSTRRPPRDCFRSYSISYAFGALRAKDLTPRGGYHYYRKMQEVKDAPQYYVFVEEEHNGSRYGENEGDLIRVAGPFTILWPPTTTSPARLVLPTAMRTGADGWISGPSSSLVEMPRTLLLIPE
jgi:hypothetical protein